MMNRCLQLQYSKRCKRLSFLLWMTLCFIHIPDKTTSFSVQHNKSTTTRGIFRLHRRKPNLQSTLWHPSKKQSPPCSSSSSSSRIYVSDIPDIVLEEQTTESLLDQILDESLRTSARKPLMIPFNPASKAIWKHWKGTFFAETWRSVIRKMVWTVLVYCIFQKYPSTKQFLHGFGDVWNTALSVTTFTLSFFLSQTYTLWRSCLNISRSLQGRINDLMMMLSVHAKRIEPEEQNEYDDMILSMRNCSKYAPASEKVLRIIARYLRVFHILAYASFTRSYRPLITPQGMRRLVARGLLTEKERKVLVDMKVSPTQRFNALLLWIFRMIVQARQAGIITDIGNNGSSSSSSGSGSGLDQQLIGMVQSVRVSANSIQTELRGRMPFAYAHCVQIMVDAVLWMYPIAVFTGTTSLQIGVFGVGFLTISYQGLFNLSKQFLDPYHNENFWKGEDALVVDTLVAELNAGTMRFINGLEEMPIPYSCFKDGNSDALDEHILPELGYTRQEAQEAQKQKNQFQPETVARTLSPREIAERVEEALETYQEEYEETQLILNAPPASDFVPGLDDEGESLEYLYDSNGNSMDTDDDDDDDDDDDEDEEEEDIANGGLPSSSSSKTDDVYEQFIEATEEEHDERGKLRKDKEKK